MSRESWIVVLVATCGLVFAGETRSMGADASSNSAADAAEMQLPPGWTAEDMQAMIESSTPGKMHEHLIEGVGTWHGKMTMWMAPDAEPIVGESNSVVSPMFDGRFTKLEMTGECPNMGPFSGLGIYGFDNVSQKFTAVWLSNHGTGIMTGEGELSPDGKTLSWEYTGNCPIARKPIVVRDVETITGPDTRILESFATDPKTGQEFKMMRIELTRE